MPIQVYLKKEKREIQARFLEIVKWIRRFCPEDPIRLFLSSSEDIDYEGVKDLEIHTLPGSFSPDIDERCDALRGEDTGGRRTVLLWGPDSVQEPLADRWGAGSSLAPFSTQIRLVDAGEKETEQLPTNLIHADPRPMEPSVNSDPTQGSIGVFTGVITKNSEKQETVFPIHSRGAEVTANIVKSILNGRPVSSQAFLYPLVAMIEPSRRCNLACPLCPVGASRTSRIPDMPLSLFKKTIDELKPFLSRLFLHNYGEPFLHRDIYRMMAYTKEEGIPDVEISTNGHILDPSRLIESGLDEIKISLDGTTQESYARYRRGGKLERVIENVRQLVREKERRGTAKPLLELQFIIMRHNEDQMDGFRTLATELGAERIRFKTFNIQMSGPEACQLGVEFLPTRPEYSRYQDGEGISLKRHLEENRCKWPWEWVVINSDGNVVPCCNDFDGLYSMGNLADQSFREIWFGEKYDRFRKDVLRKWREIPLCSHCPVPSLGDLSFERVETPKR
jgi:radical SAM protein with 4Fe4S-binding SPASM domain